MSLLKDNLLFGFAPKLTDEQRIFVDAILDDKYKIVFCNAPSGSGKTTLAVACAKLIGKELVYVFSPVEEKKLGFSPGTIEEKESKYIVPLKDALAEINENPDRVIISEHNIDNIKQGNAWVKPMSHVFARGINIKNSTIIVDECQNFTRGELKKVLTRIHDSCKTIVIGHSGQCDLPDAHKSGFLPYLKFFEWEPYCKVCTLSHDFRGIVAAHADKLEW